jgi:outer membrane immunogenic protein
MRTVSAISALLLAALVLPSTPAQADGSSPPIWQGFYVGAQVGSANAKAKIDYPISGHSVETHTSVGVGAVQVGYDIASGGWVFGPEIVRTASIMPGSKSCPNPDFTCHADTKAMTLLNLRLGRTFGNFLIYGTGGFAMGDMTYRANYTGPDAAQAGHKYDQSQAHTGWNGGVGFDYAFAARWTAGFEYRHVFLETAAHASHNNFNARVTDRNLSASADLVSARINYHFGR